MAMITLHNASLPEVTILSNTFIDNYMPEANGEFVKVYIYLLRALSSAPVSFSLEQMADRLLCTERDILRALKYWAKQQLLTLDFTDNNKLCGISLLTPVGLSILHPVHVILWVEACRRYPAISSFLDLTMWILLVIFRIFLAALHLL